MSKLNNHPATDLRADPIAVQSFERVRDVLAEIVGLSGSARAARLDELAGSDPPLISAVQELLHNSDAADRAGFLMDDESGSNEHPHTILPTPALVGPYRVLERIGEGGVGFVYLAESPSPLNRRVAIKVAKATGPTRSALRASVEAEALASLNHPGVAQLYETGVLEDGRRWMACEWIDGRTIGSAAKGAHWRWVVGLLVQAAEALHHAHQRGVIHRDLKPSNLLVTGDGTDAGIKVIDFGVARLLGVRDDSPGITEPGLLVGTLSYMSPEQLAAGNVDARTDVYAMGLVACELLTGSPPPGRYAGLTELTNAAKSPVRVRLHGCDGHERDLAAIIAKATEPDPSRRYPSMQHLADDLQRVLRRLPVEARPAGMAHHIRLYTGRHPVLSSSALLTLVVMSVLVGLLLWSRERLAAEVRDQQHLVGELVNDTLLGLREIRGTREYRLVMVDSLMSRVERHASENPDSHELQLLLARTLRERGDIAAGIGHYADAERDLLRSLEIYSKAHERTPSDVETGRRYAEGLVRIGDVRLDRDLGSAVQESMRLYLDAMRVQENLLASHPQHDGLLDDMSWSYDRIGELGDRHGIAMPRGDLESWMNERIDLSLRLLSLAPERVLSHYSLGTGYLRLARYYGHRGQFNECHQAVLAGLPSLMFAVESDPNRTPFVQILLGLYSWEVNALLGMNRNDDVYAAAQRLVDAARSHANAQPGDLLAEQSLISALMVAANGMKQVGDSTGCRTFATDAIIRLELLETKVSSARWAELQLGLSSMRELLTELE